MSTFSRFAPFLTALVLALGFVTFDASDAYAKKGIAIINTGEQIFPVGPLPDAIKGEDSSDVQIATMCSQFGIFWAAVWTSDCRFVVYSPSQDAYDDIPPELMPEVEKVYSLSDGERGLWNRFGLAVILFLIAGYAAIKMFVGADHDEEE